MSDVTIKQLANVLGTPVDKLLAQLGEAGMKFNDPDQVISSTEKVKLLGFLRRTHGKKEEAPVEAAASPRQITLKRRTVSEITVVPGQRGASAKTVNVEVRQKRTYVKRSAVEEGQPVDRSAGRRPARLAATPGLSGPPGGQGLFSPRSASPGSGHWRAAGR
jgi:translation initiation factor IF-2